MVGIVTGSIINAIGSNAAADTQASAAKDAAQTQANATLAAQQLQRDMYAKNAPYWQPYTALGPQGTTAISSMLPYLTHQFSPSDLQTNLAPNYQFMLGQGLGAQRQAQNVTGGGSNMTRAADIFSQNYAQNAYQNAFNNYSTQRSNIYNTLQSISQMGMQGAAGLSNLGAGVATNIGTLGVQGATAIGAGQVGAANAWGNAIANTGGSIGNAAMMYGLMNQGNAVPTLPKGVTAGDLSFNQETAPANWYQQTQTPGFYGGNEG